MVSGTGRLQLKLERRRQPAAAAESVAVAWLGVWPLCGWRGGDREEEVF